MGALKLKRKFILFNIVWCHVFFTPRDIKNVKRNLLKISTQQYDILQYTLP